jgi:hypothetical protein
MALGELEAAAEGSAATAESAAELTMATSIAAAAAP